MANPLQKLLLRLMEPEIKRRINLAVRAIDDSTDLALTQNHPRDRYNADREDILRETLEAWRKNPLARRIVSLMTQYVVGGGITVECKDTAVNQFISAFWNHRLNRMSTRLYEWCDELTRAGDLFLVFSTDAAGMSYVRAIPAAQIQEIESASNDIEQEVVIWEKPDLRHQAPGADGFVRGRRWDVYDPVQDSGEAVMVHYAVNRAVGAQWGESDLAPLLRWLSRYANWLEDRVRLNRYRNTFLFWVRAKFLSEADRIRRQAELNANPPSPGSILVTDESETWDVLNSKLEAYQAGEDGLSIKKMLAAGSGTPLHFLAEPESSTRTTAEAAGEPAFRNYEQRQKYFLWIVEDVLRIALRRRAVVDNRINPLAVFSVKGADISQRDNASLASASHTALTAFERLRERGLIDDAELLRITYRFAGELVDVEAMLERGGDPHPGPLPEGRG